MGKANIKFNNGNGANCCNRCNIILSYGNQHNETQAAYCGDCYDEAMKLLHDAMDDLHTLDQRAKLRKRYQSYVHDASYTPPGY